MPVLTKRLFLLNQGEIQQSLFCDNSDDEEALELNDEDVQFLENDLEDIEQNTNAMEPAEVVIEPAYVENLEANSISEIDCSNNTSRSSRSVSNSNIQFSWQKLQNQTFPFLIYLDLNASDDHRTNSVNLIFRI